jgi:hypothetical protein
MQTDSQRPLVRGDDGCRLVLTDEQPSQAYAGVITLDDLTAGLDLDMARYISPPTANTARLGTGIPFHST